MLSPFSLLQPMPPAIQLHRVSLRCMAHLEFAHRALGGRACGLRCHYRWTVVVAETTTLVAAKGGIGTTTAGSSFPPPPVHHNLATATTALAVIVQV